jgi:phosphosulfolactate synthase
MLTHPLDLPARQAKPRTQGLTMVIDNGTPTSYFMDSIGSCREHIDLVKFGWGTSLVSADITRKIDYLRELEIDFFFGGTLFEKFLSQGRFDDFRAFCHRAGAAHVEVSNGTIDLSYTEKASYVAKLADEFTVLSEVGFKDAERSEMLSPSQWVDSIRADLDAGSSRVILEARESGRGGICRPDGRLRFGLLEDVLRSGVPTEALLFEAPTKDLQTHFIRRIGTDVNLGNIAPDDVIGLETLRLGLRSDTMLDVH